MELLLEGFLFGLTVSLLVGPILLVLLQSSIQHGRGAGLRVASGMWTSDFLFIVLVFPFYTRMEQMIKESDFQTVASLIGSGLLFIFGTVIILNANNPSREIQPKQTLRNIGFWLRGFLINSLNPFTIFFWIGIVTTFVVTRKANTQGYFLFNAGLMTAVISLDAAKVYYADQIGKRLQPRVVRKISIFSGLALIIFGLYLILRSII